MANPFEGQALAVGYATHRPAVHPLVLDLLRSWHADPPVGLAVDVGCGAGLSTSPLARLARQVVGFDPAASMVQVARHRVPTCTFLIAGAEAMPFGDSTVDLLTAAGSLNYARDLDATWSEIVRVLRPGGMLAVYDFAAGRSFEDDASLDAWFTTFTTRYPYPPRQAIPLSPTILADRAMDLELTRSEEFALPLPLTLEFYLGYMLTESNVRNAIGLGTAPEDIRAWCATTLADVFGGRARTVVFRGYLATLGPRAPHTIRAARGAAPTR
jgi:SAM-dependent methyltransferase